MVFVPHGVFVAWDRDFSSNFVHERSHVTFAHLALLANLFRSQGQSGGSTLVSNNLHWTTTSTQSLILSNFKISSILCVYL